MIKSINNVKKEYKNKTYFDYIINKISYVINFCYNDLVNYIKIAISCIFITISYIYGFLFGCLINLSKMDCNNYYENDIAYGFKHGVNSVFKHT
jgi:predicted N-acyltransferase